MKIPRYVSPAAIDHQLMPLPAVSAIIAGGFLAESATVACFETTKDAIPFLLLSYEQRRVIAVAIPDFDNIHDRLAPDHERFAVLRPNGTRGRWYNAENLWVAVPWILGFESRLKDPNLGTQLLFALARSAAM